MPSKIEASANTELDYLLEIICESLQLTETQVEKAKSHYGDVGEWLGTEGTKLEKLSPQIRPQGSFPQGTVVKPIGRNDADVDLVCLLDVQAATVLSPRIVYDLVMERLEENDGYRQRLTKNARCLTLKYADGFCLDILPAVPAMGQLGFILIPDRELNRWIPTNPFGFTDWFQKKARTRKVTARAALAKKADVTPLPTTGIATHPLQRATQLFKRRRDRVYQSQDWRPASIVLTALSGMYYDGNAITCDALITILDRISEAIRGAESLFSLPNPIDANENLVHEWLPSQRHGFANFATDFADQMRLLLTTRGIQQIQKALTSLFGEKLATAAMQCYAKRFQENREQGRLHQGKSPIIVSSLTVGASASPVARNTFYGS